MKPRSSILLPLLIALAAGCAAPPSDTITQVATIDALLAGVYDGHLSLAELAEYGDFGIGTFQDLDGEMVLLDGIFYQVRSDGRVYRPELSVATPFATVIEFSPDYQEELTGPLTMAGLEEKIRKVIPTRNLFGAFQVRGGFSRMKTRSVPAQKKPFPPLAGVTANQPVFELGEARGTLIGFYSPDFVRGVNVPGFHMHFLADNLSGGGHVLDFELAEGLLEVDTVHDALKILLPVKSAGFATADLTLNREEELEQVDKERGEEGNRKTVRSEQ